MRDISTARWEPLHDYHRNRASYMHHAYGLHWRDDPWCFTHRALVFTRRNNMELAWYVRVWAIRSAEERSGDNVDRGEWVDTGEFKTKQAAMRHARGLVPIFHALQPGRYDEDE